MDNKNFLFVILYLSYSTISKKDRVSNKNKGTFMKLAHPKALYFLSVIEMWERFSFYGMRALLTLYMVNHLMLGTQNAGNIYGLYTGLVYATPLIGGYIADRYLGAKHCILIGAILMALGHFIMAFSPLPFFFMALILLILGNGFFKPNISSIVGQLYKKDDYRRDGGFTIFYMSINIGAFFSPLLCGTLGEKIGFHYGFATAGVGMLISLLIFLWGKKKYLQDHGLPPAKCNNVHLTNCYTNQPLTTQEKKRIVVIFILVFFSIFFWASFEQAGSSLTLFAHESTNRVIPFLNWEFPVSYFQAINPFFIFLLAPLFSGMWMKLSKVGKDLSIPAKFSLGLIFVALGFFLMVIASVINDSFGKISFVWLIGVYLLHTIGELCLSPVGLSAVTKLAPVKFASLLMGVWFLSNFLANFIGGIFAGNYDTMNHSVFFMYPVILAGGSGVLLLILSGFLNNWMNGKTQNSCESDLKESYIKNEEVMES